MNKKYFVIVFIACIFSLTIFYLYFMEEEIKCPKCNSIYVWTPLGTRSENFLWKCLECNYTWRKTYSEITFRRWRENSVKIVVYVVMKYISKNHEDAKNFISKDFKMKSRSENISCIIYKFEDVGWILSIIFLKTNNTSIIVADYSATRIPGYIGIMHRIIWEGIFTNSGEIIEKKYIHAV